MESYVRSAQLGGFLLEFLLLSIALAERINREKSSRMQAQAALLSIQEKTNKLLEERVASRTQALEQVNRELVQLSNTDPLTGLNNRRGFEERLHLIIERGRAEGIYIAFLMIDIDYFKRINDAHGHSFGDECLALLGQTLAKFTRRDSEFAARIGGEEFAAALYGVHADNALAVAEQIRAEIAELVVSDTTSMVRFTVSIGVAAWVPGCSDSKITFAKAADEALYLAKARGRNQVCLAQSN
jgi:diguanylate cyclase